MNDTAATSPRDVSVDITLEGRGSFSASGPDDLVFKALAEFREEIGGSVASAAPLKQERKSDGVAPKRRGRHLREVRGRLALARSLPS